MTVFDRSRCREGAGWIETNEGRSEFHKVCKRLDQAKDEVKGANTLLVSFALSFALRCLTVYAWCLLTGFVDIYR